MKSILGLVLAFGVGFFCRASGIPSPSPTLLIGAIFAITITTGYQAVNRLLGRRKT